MKAREFIVFGVKNNIKNLIVNAINDECREKAIIHFDSNAMPIVSENVCPYHMYEVEVEEEITEDTVIPKMLVIYYKNAAHIQINKNLNFLIKDNLKSVYIMNDDKTMTLIWTKEKGLIKCKQ